MTEEMLNLIEALTLIEEDMSVPKNIRFKIKNALLALQEEDKELRVKANKALQELDDIADNPNVPPYIRPQIWNIVSLLAGI
ncbi:MAG: UPF0147 family protein [Nanoarchaeota archaeon]|nr:UPF0147 family protein [Nanoarchaeota archaeon]